MPARPGPQRHPSNALLALLVLLAPALLAPAGAAEPAAAQTRYLQLDPHWTDEPYQWQLDDGTVLSRGVTDAQARAAVAARPGHDRYALETVVMRYPMRIAAACWKRPQAEFAHCVEPGPAGPSRGRARAEAEAERALDEAQQRRRERAAWTGLDAQAVAQRLRGALAAQAQWEKTLPARRTPAQFDCAQSSAPPPLAPAGQGRFRAALEAGARTPAGEAELIAAARTGHWRAAAALANLALYDDDWESAQTIAAWLLERDLPAGYNALARSLGAADAYEHGRAAPAEREQSARLRWRAVQAGDPGAQMDLADQLADSDPDAAERLRACARGRFPDIDD
ncbi:hypothetical protein J5226_24840 [Lysobacter sp. K5869]|uniref:hypothetical protein n=1 Tax=Lysobacter sp. K5869 TaxID=2820808 RepID=UPI001C0614F2|nr:hypothetical protein [Lysobacter sp. K5869]QWP76759.1 hypothetical protein J5226_24840 [Lysobacter sp. K5869]